MITFSLGEAAFVGVGPMICCGRCLAIEYRGEPEDAISTSSTGKALVPTQ